MLLKQQLQTLCQSYLDKNIQNAEAAIADARDAAQNETKSSAGDKYETAREMMQQEIDLNTTRLYKLKAQQQILQYINPEQENNIAINGSVVYTNQGNFYIAISAGLLTVGGEKYYAISIESPIGKELKGKQAGDNFNLNAKEYIINKII